MNKEICFKAFRLEGEKKKQKKRRQGHLSTLYGNLFNFYVR